jgi:cobyric acid synthase
VVDVGWLVGYHRLGRHDDGNQNHNQFFPSRLYNPSSLQLYPSIIVINGSTNTITDLSEVKHNNSGKDVLPQEEG